jgi:hypothetical protein
MLKIILILLILLFNNYILQSSIICLGKHFRNKTLFSIELSSVIKVFNPSIINKKKKYILCTRYSYRTHKNLFDNIYSTIINKYEYSKIIFIEVYKNNLYHKYYYKLIDIPNSHTKGQLEDPRFIEYNNLYIVLTTEYISTNNTYPVLYIFDTKYNFVKRTEIMRFKGIHKNWCPFEHKGKLYIHTDTYPEWKVFELDINNGKLKQVINTKFPLNSPENMFLRCSTSWKIYNEKYYICGLHIKTYNKSLPQIRSVLVLIDRITLLPVLQSDILCLEYGCDRIQFLSGIEIDNNYIILAYGVGDFKIVCKKIHKNHVQFK